VCVGVGVSTGAQVGEILAYADGAIVGSALVAALGQGLGRLEDVAAELRSGVVPGGRGGPPPSTTVAA
jgi:tryptophan synthase alpha chain